MKRSRGFSLIELLCVTGIMAIIAAVLAPVLVSAKKSAMRAQCASNLRQIGQAFESYATDYAGCYPNTGSQYLWAGFFWREPLARYLQINTGNPGKRMVLSCPADPTPTGVYSGTSYAYSACFYMEPEQVNAVADSDHMRAKYASTNPKLPCSNIKTSQVKFGSKKALVAEYWTLHSVDSDVGWYDGPETGHDPWSGERNCMFADSHVVYLSTRRIRAAESPTVGRPRLLPDINLTTDGVAGKDID